MHGRPHVIAIVTNEGSGDDNGNKRNNRDYTRNPDEVTSILSFLHLTSLKYYLDAPLHLEHLGQLDRIHNNQIVRQISAPVPQLIAPDIDIDENRMGLNFEVG